MPTSIHAPHGRLLCHVARAFLCKRGIVIPDGAGGQPEAIDAEALVQLAAREGMAPLILWMAKQDHRLQASLSDEVVSQLQAQKQRQHLHSLTLAGELVRTIRLFQSNGIGVVPFKGPTFAQRYYGDVGRRSFMDLDLLVPREQLLRARDLLVAAGYAPAISLSPTEEQAFLESRLAYELFHRQRGTKLELHWSLLPAHNGSTLPSELLWQTASPTLFSETPTRTLHKPLYFIYLCAHASKHRWAKLKWLVDLALLQGTLSFAERVEVREQARQLGFARVVATGLLLLRKVLQVPVPATLVPLTTDRIAQHLTTEVLDRWLFDELGEGPFREATWFHLRERERLRDRVPFLLHSLRLVVRTSERDKQFVQLPGYLTVAYPLIRALRVLSTDQETRVGQRPENRGP